MLESAGWLVQGLILGNVLVLSLKLCSLYLHSFNLSRPFKKKSNEIWRHFALYYLLTTGWMGSIRMRVQTADKNITIIHK